ncbi:hypothetical protein X769_31995 [Mesorhizobium sp. LSJC268A00]|nr:hypothetical protein X773_34190 [Mesorhizobium sp. LSJC285A00]ESW63586.1 hypothetical protein X771_29220 [Mesorhizobium sp. LSJC277A00]ESW94729.1 hypothetical protein X769_31995 [Mesorhizobium sp. LSJC268A00]ESX78551.1 hypothetical protein X757_09855 [Mesorhizobium sp. LSHC414A00]ESY26344.1 hypothetical protein X751_00325 [Mesorhizobium sp. LNJC395A00]ESY31654.1 hypothetical protein X749_09425 [Mesorhizobium sp. LNJC391B00]ESZ53483.1 hypothetical protein X728_33110 [Mesorhizobium sp. L103C
MPWLFSSSDLLPLQFVPEAAGKPAKQLKFL